MLTSRRGRPADPMQWPGMSKYSILGSGYIFPSLHPSGKYHHGLSLEAADKEAGLEKNGHQT